MDYGKTAYLKAEDLEIRMSRMESRTRAVVSDLTVRPAFDTSCGKLVVSSVRSGGNASYLCIVSVRVYKSGGTLSLNIGGLKSGAPRSAEAKTKSFSVLSWARRLPRAARKLRCRAIPDALCFPYR